MYTQCYCTYLYKIFRHSVIQIQLNIHTSVFCHHTGNVARSHRCSSNKDCFLQHRKHSKTEKFIQRKFILHNSWKPKKRKFIKKLPITFAGFSITFQLKSRKATTLVNSIFIRALLLATTVIIITGVFFCKKLDFV